ncbi:hypothetical protein EDB81DRAFT_865508 [Dactylonectria macrodidyma]|uniref:DNA-directed RNA polymerase subunit n=1 Tax=Dactylonectria macrodidyma TaxID=307937 RepID=A0A9P9JMA4_9HYPO|nr:hypothetical protein EDB81DRAFT_865508 [Dactylonectria macrodidyma]
MAVGSPAALKHEKKSKKEKKRAREDDATGDGERKHKKSKSVSAEIAAEVVNGDLKVDKKKKKSKKDKHAEAAPEGEESKPETKKHKKKKKDVEAEGAAPEEVDGDKKKKKSKKSRKEIVEPEPEAPTTSEIEEDAPADPDAMDVDVEAPSQPSKSTIHQPPDIPANPQFPFFTQTVSLYEPLYPTGWSQPVTSCQYQHLQHLQNKYVPSLRGVLLDYRNVAFGEKPGRKGAATDDETPMTVMAKDEAAVGFGWITADVDLFVPSRGAWMEGSVNLQTEGHIGVVCFGKFNASVEARRLPPSWKWVPNESPEAQGFEETASVITSDDHGVVRQIHSTGFWVDGSGERIKGKIRFRIRNFDIGTSGETSYLSLEGTMLDKKGEKTVVAEEAEIARMRKNTKGGQRRMRRRVPEFSMTRFDANEEQVQDDEEVKREVLAVSED